MRTVYNVFYITLLQISGSGTTPVSLQRLSSCLQSVIQLLECPVCLETIPPPTFQCCNGHVLCGRCRARADRCPVCRVSLGPRGRCLLADKLHNLLTTTLNHYKQKCPENKKQPYNHSALYLKSRIIADRVQGTAGDQPKPTAGTSNENSSTQEYSELSSEMTQLKESVSSDGKIRDASQNTTGDMDAKFLTSHVLVKHKISSGENNRSHNDQLSVRQVPGATPSPLITRSLSAEQIPIGNELVPAKTSCSEDDGLFLHCPFPMKSEPHCCSILNGSRTLLQHLRDVHQGPLVQYFLQPSSSGVTLRLPSSGSKALTSFTAYGDVVFFVEVAAGARPGHTLVWLWLLGDAIQADRYRLRLTLPEGDAHTGPVFPLTASWSDVVNSNCCLSIEERRYISGNLEVQLEILDVLKTN